MALIDRSAGLNYPSQKNLAGDVRALDIEKFNGRVWKAALQNQHIKPFHTFVPLTGTSIMSNAAMGDSTIGKITAGIEPDSHKVEMGAKYLTVDTPIVCRVIIDVLSDVQDRLSVRSRLPENFGRAIQKHEDEVLMVQNVASARTATGPVADIAGGTTYTMALAGDEDDPVKLEAAFLSVAQTLNEKEVVSDGAFVVTPAIYYTLLQNDRLLSRDYSLGNGSVAEAAIMKAGGFTLLMSNRQSQAVDDGTTVGSIGNLYGSDYHTDATAAKILATYITNESLMVAEAIPLTSKVWWNDTLMCWYIDAFKAFGCTPDRADYTAGIFSA